MIAREKKKKKKKGAGTPQATEKKEDTMLDMRLWFCFVAALLPALCITAHPFSHGALAPVAAEPGPISFLFGLFSGKMGERGTHAHGAPDDNRAIDDPRHGESYLI